MPRGNPNPPPLPHGPGHGRTPGAKNKLTRERVETELRRIALLDPDTLFDRTAKGKRTFTLKEISAMAPDTRACIASIKVRTENLAAGDGQQDTTIEVKLWDKMHAIELCMKYLKMIDNKLTLELSVDEGAKLLMAARQRLVAAKGEQ